VFMCLRINNQVSSTGAIDFFGVEVLGVVHFCASRCIVSTKAGFNRTNEFLKRLRLVQGAFCS